MTLIRALAKLREIGLPVIGSGDAAVHLGVSASNASAILARLAKEGVVVRIKRGMWAMVAGTDPMVLASYLTAPLPCYISLQTALYHHGMISQIPQTTFCVSLARTRVYRTPSGVVSVHHIPACMFFGYGERTTREVRMAVPEKALVDFLYLGQAKTRLFAALPEITFPASFNKRLARNMADRVPYALRRTYVRCRLESLLNRTTSR